MKIRNKRAQLTIFVIIAIVIVGALSLLFIPKVRQIFVPQTPEQMLPKDCVEKAVTKAMNLAALHGGTIKPELYFMYDNETLDYLCYTNQWYQTCTMQKPLLKQSIEDEVEAYTKKELQQCLNTMEENLKSRGYSVQTKGTKAADIKIIPDSIEVSFDVAMTLQKDEVQQTIPSDKFTIDIKSNMYELVMIASSIQNFEARYGDSSIETYMGFYPDVKVEKLKQSDGTKVYKLTDRNTEEKLWFAIRSLSWPPGYSIVPA